jgi:glycine cleavage system H protein
MFAVFVLLTFALFIGLDYAVSRRRAAREARALAPPLPADILVGPEPAAEPVWVSGYQLPERLHYHRGHAWVKVLGPDTAVVGIDDFARRLVGHASKLSLPKAGSWLLQGGKGFAVQSGERIAEFLSPVEGKVLEVNKEATRNPEVCNDDCYGRGWLFKIRAANLAANLRNLLSGRLARRWVEDAREQLELRLMALSGSVLQDGGEPSPDFAEHLDPADWRELAGTFLLTPAPGAAREEREAEGALR